MTATADGGEIRRDVASLLLPPRRIPVSDSAVESLRVIDGGGRAKPWDPALAPYMTKPMNCLSSRHYDAVVFVGPARSAKTMALVDGGISYIVTCDPADTLVVQISEEKAREYSKKRLDREFRLSPALAEKLSGSGHDNNVHDRIFKAGNYLGIKWPSKNILSSSDYRFVFLTDYDKMAEDVGGEGDAFTLASKRTQTFGSTGMTVAEGSPGREITDHDWVQPEEEPHRAPPTTGLLSLYNMGDRQRLYWPCPHCGEFFQPIFEHWHAASARPFCPHCSAMPEPRDKRAMNANHIWLPEGCRIVVGRRKSNRGEISIEGEPIETRIASFWMEGPAAAMQSWKSLQRKLETAEAEYAQTGAQKRLKTLTNVDWGRPYKNRLGTEPRSSERLMDRAEHLAPREVPPGVRYLLCCVDVQGGKDRRFVVQVEGFGVDGERWVVDRFNIREDRGPSGDEPPRQIDPATCPEDWDILTRDLGHKSYRLADGSGRRMQVALVGVDMGGEGAGGTSVSSQAYAWWRRASRAGLSRRMLLVKGSGALNAPRLKTTYPSTSGRKDRKKSGSRGDVPLLQVGTNEIKDLVANYLERESPGPGYVHIPDWLGRWFHDELTYEVRDDRGRWKKPGGKANEAFDLVTYNTALHLHLGGERIDWDRPPAWAAEWDHNLLVIPEEHTPGHSPDTTQTKRGRRQRRSKYLG